MYRLHYQVVSRLVFQLELRKRSPQMNLQVRPRMYHLLIQVVSRLVFQLDLR